jgi:hypothetical protein
LHRVVSCTWTKVQVVGEEQHFSYDAQQVDPKQDHHTYDAAAFLPFPLPWQKGAQESCSSVASKS